MPHTAHTKSDLKAKQKAKSRTTTSVQSSVYCKRATGATASSATKLASAAALSGSSSHKKRSGTGGSTASSTKKKSSPQEASLARKDSEPVDFVYDIDVRRKLREEIDSERAKILHDTTLKEAELRAANKWVYDKTDRPERKQAWRCSDRQHGSREDKASKFVSSSRTGAKSTARASSAASSRSSSSSSAHFKSSSKPVKSSIAPNVSEWRTQAFPVYPSPETAMAEWKRAEEQRRQQQWREAKDVHDTIDDFEARMHQLEI